MNKLKNYFKMWLIPMLAILVIVSCDDREGLTSPTIITTPTVTSTNPVNAAVNVPFNQSIAVTFSEEMDSLFITTAAFTLMQGTSFVSGTVSLSGTTATFAPLNNLAPNTTYTATITTTAKSLLGGQLAKNYIWSFTTGAAALVTPPIVNSTNPLNAATAVPINKKISATFSVAMDAATITTSTFTVLQDTIPVIGFVSYSGTTALFTPANNLAPNTLFTATITTGAEDLEGNSLTNNYVWSFTTGAAVVIQYTVGLSSNPALGGNTSGGSGSFNDGSSVTVTATPNVGFTFTNWTESGNIVSTNANYTFTISKNTTLVANFTAVLVGQFSVSLTSNPALGGNTSGSGSFDDGSSVTVTATPNVGFTFTNWTESGNIVSTNANYTFTLSKNTTLVANFTSLGAQLPIDLGTTSRFAILSNSDITNLSTSDIKGDVGISPGLRSNITGFFGFAQDPGLTYSTSPEVTEGFIYASDDASPTPAMLIAAKTDAETAYLDATAAVRGTPTPISGNINGLTLAPGLYESGSSIEISPGGKLYLDAGGDASAVFIIRSATSITTEATSEVVLAGSANAANIFWVAGSAATLGTNCIMKGTIIASTSISLLTGATLEGRVIIQSAAAGQISLDQCTIVLP
jgi:hypothetical protein